MKERSGHQVRAAFPPRSSHITNRMPHDTLSVMPVSRTAMHPNITDLNVIWTCSLGELSFLFQDFESDLFAMATGRFYSYKSLG